MKLTAIQKLRFTNQDSETKTAHSETKPRESENSTASLVNYEPNLIGLAGSLHVGCRCSLRV